jgi:hypothetical protein
MTQPKAQHASHSDETQEAPRVDATFEIVGAEATATASADDDCPELQPITEIWTSTAQ